MKIVLFANTGWYLFNFRQSLARALRDAGHEILLVSPPDPYGERLARLGFRWVAAPMRRRSLNPVRELALVAWLARLFRRERVDLVHGFTIKCAVHGSLAARLASVGARVNSVAGLGYVFVSDDLTARLLRPVVRALLRVALAGEDARLILQNPDDVTLFTAARLVDPSAVRLIRGSGVDCSRFVPAPGRHRHSRFRVLLATRLLWDKGVAEFVEAARQLRSEGAAVDCLLAGDPDPGNPAAVPVATVRQWVDEGAVSWLGHVEDMPALLRDVDAVALPSYREGLPKTLIEAAASGLPLVTTDAPGCREVVSHGVTGLLVPIRDARSLAAAIGLLQADPALCERLGTAARAQALTVFEEGAVNAQTISVYDELVPRVIRS